MSRKHYMQTESHLMCCREWEPGRYELADDRDQVTCKKCLGQLALADRQEVGRLRAQLERLQPAQPKATEGRCLHRSVESVEGGGGVISTCHRPRPCPEHGEPQATEEHGIRAQAWLDEHWPNEYLRPPTRKLAAELTAAADEREREVREACARECRVIARIEDDAAAAAGAAMRMSEERVARHGREVAFACERRILDGGSDD